MCFGLRVFHKDRIFCTYGIFGKSDETSGSTIFAKKPYKTKYGYTSFSEKLVIVECENGNKFFRNVYFLKTG